MVARPLRACSQPAASTHAISARRPQRLSRSRAANRPALPVFGGSGATAIASGDTAAVSGSCGMAAAGAAIGRAALVAGCCRTAGTSMLGAGTTTVVVAGCATVATRFGASPGVSSTGLTVVMMALTVAIAWFEVTPLPDAVAVFVIEPAVTSAATVVYVRVHAPDWPDASGRGLMLHTNVPRRLSSTVNGPD